MPTFVNLDAMIQREDFAVQEDSQSPSQLSGTLRVSDLERAAMLLSTLRKPDFQRETNNWSPPKVAKFIESFLAGNLVPAIILWRSNLSGNIFIIDGAHRLSALIAWAHDDYGDRDKSVAYFHNDIPTDQLVAAKETRDLIDEGVGSYARISKALVNQDTSPTEYVEKAKKLSIISIALQWVVGDADNAEQSFFTINMEATPITPTEMRMIYDRSRPNALAARALTRAGTGHQYWSKFPPEVQKHITNMARKASRLLLHPPVISPTEHSDLPLGNMAYSSESGKLALDFVEFANRDHIKTVPETRVVRNKPKTVNVTADDPDGQETLKYLTTVYKRLSQILGRSDSPGSLALHPYVYFYTATGRFQPTALLAASKFIKEVDAQNKLPFFTGHRYRLEEFIVKHNYFVNQIVHTRGSDERGLNLLVALYHSILKSIASGDDDIAIAHDLLNSRDFKGTLRLISEHDETAGKSFSRDRKKAAILNAELESSLRCNICRARITVSSSTLDHIERRADGGSNSVSNAAVTHPYCNTGYKEYMNTKGIDVSGQAMSRSNVVLNVTLAPSLPASAS